MPHRERVRRNELRSSEPRGWVVVVVNGDDHLVRLHDLRWILQRQLLRRCRQRRPNELTIGALWEGGVWRITVAGNTVGYYAPSAYDWPSGEEGAGAAGPMASGKATYLQVGGEVFNSWPDNEHSTTDMGTDYFTTSGTTNEGSVMKVPINGGTPLEIFSGASVYGVAVDATSVYFTCGDGNVWKQTPK